MQPINVMFAIALVMKVFYPLCKYPSLITWKVSNMGECFLLFMAQILAHLLHVLGNACIKGH